MSIIKKYLMQHKVTHSFESCQWPYGDPQEKDFHFCGSNTFEGKPYCENHCKAAYLDEKDLKRVKEANKVKKIAA